MTKFHFAFEPRDGDWRAQVCYEDPLVHNQFLEEWSYTHSNKGMALREVTSYAILPPANVGRETYGLLRWTWPNRQTLKDFGSRIANDLHNGNLGLINYDPDIGVLVICEFDMMDSQSYQSTVHYTHRFVPAGSQTATSPEIDLLDLARSLP